ncbi:hypothetical protein U1Q18_003252 [Sarracenia purpurea var. burkii]
MTVATAPPSDSQASLDPLSKWHKRLGHPSSRKLKELALVLCLKNKKQCFFLCPNCSVYKIHKLPFPKSRATVLKPLESSISPLEAPSLSASILDFHVTNSTSASIGPITTMPNNSPIGNASTPMSSPIGDASDHNSPIGNASTPMSSSAHNFLAHASTSANFVYDTSSSNSSIPLHFASLDSLYNRCPTIHSSIPLNVHPMQT